MVDDVDFDVQVQMGSGLPAFWVVDHCYRTVAGSRERVGNTVDFIDRALPPGANHCQPGAAKPR